MTVAGMKATFSSMVSNPESQRKMVLVVVCIALLLDNMLYMVIVPIIPDYLQAIASFGNEQIEWTNGSYTKTLRRDAEVFNITTGKYQMRWLVMPSDAKIGTLFAFKAIVQLLCNPISGTIIDRIGYDIPMMFGLSVIYVSTSMFAFGTTYGILFLARGLQGLGSAFADTAGLAMIADRYTNEGERTKALGIALAFISFGSLVAPPFGGILYQFFGKEIPFICLAFIALIDGFLLIAIMQPVRIERTVMKSEGRLSKGTPIYRLLMDPYIAICAGTLMVANVSLAFLEPTISTWMAEKMHSTNAQEGLVWLPAFLPHLAGVITTVRLASKYPKLQWLMAAIGLAVEGFGCFFIPFCSNFVMLMIPISILCYGIALVDTAILPTMGFLVDTRHVSVYGSVYAIADISYSIAYAFGPILAGNLMKAIDFLGINMIITVVTLAYVPVLFLLRNCNDECGRSEDPGNERSAQEKEDSKEILRGTPVGSTYQNSPSHYPGYHQGEGDIPPGSSNLTHTDMHSHGQKPLLSDQRVVNQREYGYG